MDIGVESTLLKSMERDGLRWGFDQYSLNSNYFHLSNPQATALPLKDMSPGR